MAFTALVTAPNYVFQSALEHRFPTRTIPKTQLTQVRAKDKRNDEELLRSHGRLNIRNTIAKFVLDQSLSATTNTVLFIVVLGLIRGQSWEYIEGSLYRVSVAAKRFQIRNLCMAGFLADATGRVQVLAGRLPAQPCDGPARVSGARWQWGGTCVGHFHEFVVVVIWGSEKGSSRFNDRRYFLVLFGDAWALAGHSSVVDIATAIGSYQDPILGS